MPDTPIERRIIVRRSARYYRAGGERDPREVWIVLHGFGMLAERFLKAFAPVAGPDRMIVAPEALNRYYTNHEARKVGATWMTSEDRQAEIADYVRYLDQVLDQVRKDLPRPPARVEIHGFSQGAATATRWLAFGQVRPVRVVLWGGGVPPDLDLARHGETLSGANLTLVLGDRDRFLSEERVAAETSRLDLAGVKYALRRFSGGHTIPWPVLESLAG